jgi:SagB-type dehydrogenase family enzyme
MMKPSKETMRALRVDIFKRWEKAETDQRKGLPRPPLQKPFPADSQFIDLPHPAEFIPPKDSLVTALRNRISRREYLDEPLKLEELSFLLWATQGVRGLPYEGRVILRTVPSAGARHPFETYLAVLHIDGLKPGVYRYLGVEHKLLIIREDEDFAQRLSAACADFAVHAAVTFIWSALAYRTEWRYPEVAAKLIAQDSGHVCQNLYVACEGIGAGTCAVGAYDQDLVDEMLELDPETEMVVYSAPVGKV